MLILSLISSKKCSIRLEGQNLYVEIPLVKYRFDGILNVHVEIPALERTGSRWFFTLKFSLVNVRLDILRFKKRDSSDEKKESGRGAMIIPFLLKYAIMPSIVVESLVFEINHIVSPSPAACWKCVLQLYQLGVNMEGVRTRNMSLELKQLVGKISVSDQEKEIQWISLSSVDLNVSNGILGISLSSINCVMDLETYFKIIPTLGNLLFASPPPSAPQPSRSSSPPLHLPFSIDISVDVLTVQFSSQSAGSAFVDISRISGIITADTNINLKVGGCLMSNSDFSGGEMVRVPAFTVVGGSRVIDINIPQALLRTGGLVYWIRALVLCGSKMSATKRPHRLDTRNARTKIFYDYELCGIEPADWTTIANYVPSIVPVRIRVNFSTCVEIRTTEEPVERIITEDAVIDCNLPDQAVRFTANSIEVFGSSRQRCAFIKKFSGFVSLFSNCRLKDSGSVLASIGSVSEEIKTHFAQPSELGPVPVAICFADITGELAEELILLIGNQLMQAVEEMRKWDIDLGYKVVPLYKPVTVRLSRVRFAPLELAPAVLDVKEFEVAIGPTKDCLSFAFIGVKAWVPSTVTVPPILHVEPPVTVSLRVKRAVPLSNPVVNSDYASQAGCWRDLKMGIPKIKGAVAPGLHATTRLIDTIMKTVRKSAVGKKSNMMMMLKKGPIKSVEVKSEGGRLCVVRREDVGGGSSSTDEGLGEIEFGAVSIELSKFMKNVFVKSKNLRVHVAGILDCAVSEISVNCSDGDSYYVSVSNQSPIRMLVKNNAMAIFGAYSALKDCFLKAWYIDPRPRLNSVMTHIIDVNASAAEMIEGSPLPDSGAAVSALVSAKISFSFPTGVELVWSVPNSAGKLSVTIPGGNKLHGESVFHGFALAGDNFFRKLPELTDQVLIQWLRYPWTIGSDDMASSSPSVVREKESWDLHAIMTMRISEYLASAGTQGCWEYASARGIVDTPMYVQILVSLTQVEVCMGSSTSRRIAGIDKFEMRAHCHNLPTKPAPSAHSCGNYAPKIKMSYWASWDQDPSQALSLDIVPQVHIPLFLTLLGSPADADPGSSIIHNFAGEEDSSVVSLQKSSSARPSSSFLDKVLSQIDLGFRITIAGITGRAGGWSFASSRISLFKEEDRGKGLIVAEVRSAQIALETALSLDEAVQPLHSRTCLSVPDWMPETPSEVLQFLSVRQMMVHIGLHSSDNASIVIQGAAPVSAGLSSPPEPTVVFCNIQGARLWWSPSLSRGMRESLSRTDQFVETLSRWKARFSKELYARLGKSPRKKKTFESIMNLLDFFIPNGGSVKLVLRCADVQMNFHTLLNGIDDLFVTPSRTSDSMANYRRSVTPPPRSDIPSHFVPFRSSDLPEGFRRAETPPSTPETPPTQQEAKSLFSSRCDCTRNISPCDLQAYKKFMNKDPLDLELPKVLSWWVKAGHLQGCPLPPLALPQFNAPPNSKRERTIGGLKWSQWVEQCHGTDQTGKSPPSVTPGIGSTKPKPRGSQMLLNSSESVFEIILTRTKGPSNLNVSFNAALTNLQGSVAPTALRGLVWLGLSGQSILRQILQINEICLMVSADLFPLRSAKVRLLIPKVLLSTDDDAFHILLDVFRNAILYRGAVIDPTSESSVKSSSTSTQSPLTPQKTGLSVRFDGLVPSGKREAIIEGLLSSLAVADASLAPSTDHLSLEYIVESIGVNLTHRQRCFVQLQLTSVVGKHSFSLNHPHRPMQFSFQVGDISIIAADPTGESGKDRQVLRSAGSSGGANIVTVRGNDRYITLNNREWQVYDTLFLSISPIVVDITQDLIEELYAFIFPPSAAGGADAAPQGSTTYLASVEEHVEVVGNKLLTGRNKSKVVKSALNRPTSSAWTNPGISRLGSDLSGKKDSTGAGVASVHTNSAHMIFFKFVRFGNIDSIITFKGKQFSLNHLSLTLKYYLKRRRLATWKEFLDEWGAKVGKQAFGSFVKHGFTRKRGIQDIIVNKFAALAGNDVDKLLFGKHSN